MLSKRSLTSLIPARVLMQASWAPLAVLLLHYVLSTIFGHEPHVDPAMHTLGGAAIALFVWQVAPAVERELGVLTPMGRGLLAFALASTVAVVWEMGEFMKPLLQSGEIDRGLANTMRDLACGMLGATFLVAVLVRGAFARSTVRSVV